MDFKTVLKKQNTLESLVAFISKPSKCEAEALTQRQLEVANLIACGFDLKTIADKLFISESTVKTHLDSIYRLTGFNNRTQITLFFIREALREYLEAFNEYLRFRNPE